MKRFRLILVLVFLLALPIAPTVALAYECNYCWGSHPWHAWWCANSAGGVECVPGDVPGEGCWEPENQDP